LVGVRYPVRPEVGVGALVTLNGRVLLVKRSNPPGKGKWSVPGGHLELGENIYHAAARELEEETGVIGEPLGVVGISELIERDEREVVLYHYVLVDILVDPRTSPDKASARSDASDVAFISLNDALGMDLTNSARGLLERLAAGDVKLLHVSTWSG
jgi:ADP-ribose pyrophosphatase YjhB (NUDIX family)